MHKYSQAERRPVHRRWSHPLFFSFVVSSLLLGLTCGCGTGKPTAATNDPDQLLRQMSERLAQAKKLSFKVDRKLDAALVEGRNIPENAQIEMSVSRPGKFLARSEGQDNVRQLVFDGQNLSVYDETMDRADAWLEQAREYVREKPVQSVAIALGAGWLLGRILRR